MVVDLSIIKYKETYTQVELAELWGIKIIMG